MFNIKIDSRKVVEGDTFVAIVGYNVDGHKYIEDAINNGAKKIIAQYGEYGVETIIVDDTNLYIKEVILNNYKDIINKMHFIGITGTNGKTSTAFIIYQMLNKLSINCAYIGTIGYYSKDKIIETKNTTPHIVELYELIVNAYNDGITHIVMEVSSHSLDLDRVMGINYDICGFTNLTKEHLDYHKTMENYLNSKLKLVDKSYKMIVNIDDKYSSYFCKKNYETIGFENADFNIIDVDYLSDKTKIVFTYKNIKYAVYVNLLGKFNVYNYILALAICSAYKNIKDIIDISDKIYPPTGRCDVIHYNNIKLVVDYAHTPDAVEKIINAFIDNKKGNIITVIGCGGDRDSFKRPIMGKLASKLSDFCIFTSDNPRNEDPNKIINDILKGVESNNYEVILDRKEAIKVSIDIAKEDDIVLILGKGHEDYQIIGNQKVHLSDKEEIEKCII